MGSRPTTIDLAFQIAYKIAHRMLRIYWGIRKPRKGGTLIAVWSAGEVLVLKNTYRRQHSFPGGYPRRGESAAQTGARELAEECGVFVRAEDAREVYHREHLFEGRRDDVTMVEVELEKQPPVHVDHREVAYARFASPEEVLGLLVVPHVREYLVERAKQRARL